MDWKLSRGSDLQMKKAAMKQESEVIADPKDLRWMGHSFSEAWDSSIWEKKTEPFSKQIEI